MLNRFKSYNQESCVLTVLCLKMATECYCHLYLLSRLLYNNLGYCKLSKCIVEMGEVNTDIYTCFFSNIKLNFCENVNINFVCRAESIIYLHLKFYIYNNYILLFFTRVSDYLLLNEIQMLSTFI